MAMCAAKRPGFALGAFLICASVAVPGHTLITPQYVDESPVVKSSDRFSLELVVPKKRMTLGEQLWVALIVTNTGQTELMFPNTRLHLEGVHGEPPTTLFQRQLTDRLNPGERALPESGFVPSILPDVYDVRRFDLSLLYSLKEPGHYAVYVDVRDQKKAVWVRSPTAEFDLLPPATPHR